MLNLFRQHSATSARVGVSFGPEGVAVAAIGRGSQGKPSLEHCAFIAGGKPTGAGLDQVLRERNLARTPLSLVIQPEDYQLVLIEAPDVLPAELRAAVRWRLKDMINFDIDEAVIDVFGIPDQSRRPAARSTYAVAARSGALDGYIGVIQHATRKLDVVDIPELCLRNLCMLTDANRTGVAMLLAGDKSGLLALVHNSFLYVARRIEWSHTYDPDLPAVAGTIDASALALEVQRSLDYYESHFDHPAVGELLIAPLNPELASLAGSLRNAIGLRVSLLDLNALLDCQTPLAPETQSQCLLAIGAALRRDVAAN